MSATTRGFTLVTYVATLDVPRHVVDHLSRLPAAHRRRIGTPRGSRALGPFRQAVLVLRWFRERGWVHCLARDAGISQATGYRYPHEGIDILADQAPDLHKVLDRCRSEAMTHVILDGTLIESDRLASVRVLRSPGSSYGASRSGRNVSTGVTTPTAATAVPTASRIGAVSPAVSGETVPTVTA
ncbi:hypothetical protein OHA79_47160 (plasmid) [Streptomyces sp. NBC_00841]|nr:hypothetical protein [Streptomyces sp. NBC_00841]WSA05173.1 hypothetical protein OHA79_47160 [Streptomyces sp. NBC_00841]